MDSNTGKQAGPGLVLRKNQMLGRELWLFSRSELNLTTEHRLFEDRVLIRINMSLLCTNNGCTEKELMWNTILLVTLNENAHAPSFASRSQAHCISWPNELLSCSDVRE